MAAEIHFVQGGDSPVLIGAGSETLTCACGNALIAGYDPLRFLGVAIQCGGCAAVTTTLALPDGQTRPAQVIIAEPSTAPRTDPMTVPAHIAVIGSGEVERLRALYRPRTPASNTYTVTDALLDEAAASFERLCHAALPAIDADGLREHALGWSVGHLRARITAGPWACMEDVPTANAVTHLTGFLHFVATWSHHPLFPAMAATAAERGFSLHGLAPFAAAHAMTMTGSVVNFPTPTGYPGRVESFDVSAAATGTVLVQPAVFDRFELPFGRAWEPASLLAAVSEAIAAAQGRINLRNPGILLLSPGTAMAAFDEALIEAVKAALASLGRKNRGLMAVAPIVLRLQPTPDPLTVRFGYGLFPLVNRHYSGAALPG